MGIPSTVTVDQLTQLPGGNWSVLVTFPDASTRRIVVPKEIANLHGIRLTAGVVAMLYDQGQL